MEGANAGEHGRPARLKRNEIVMIEHGDQWPFCEPAGLPCAGGVCGEQGEKFPLAPRIDQLNTREADQGNGSAALRIFEGRRA
ncbi:MAG: hypothetical protein BGN89_09245 [Alphaproteobacteria bacterium 64-6]|nr:MAG: hypothetical protein BGN89_09245 [Alphaproteobacteria bacterium 64-6]